MNDKVEFKECSCGSKIRLVWLKHPYFPTVDIGVADCSYCSESHFVMLGDDLQVKACANDMKSFFESKGKGVDLEVHAPH
tara:strand:- start:494 stop:733 length:240 start_codon:yes stop_codon:yes gene_type:complete